ncbi:hypothetical protein OF83DRAFT_85739 [Amylostereum chailletii]|nr:hypothetical protein OF83DRAFT_85739 [Amylostereum chailletii]
MPNTGSLGSIGVRPASTSVHTRRPAAVQAPSAGLSRTSEQHIQQPPVAGSSTLASSYSNQEYYKQGLNQTLTAKINLSSERSFGEYFPQGSSSGTMSSSASGSTSQAPANQPGTRAHNETDETNAGAAPTSDTPLRCCGETFGRRKDLLRHLTSTSAHCDTKTQPIHYCAYCWNSSSMRKDNVRRHFRLCPKFDGTRRMGPRGKLIYDGKISRVTKAEATWLKALCEGRW